MKKLLLFSMIIGFALSTFAQKQMEKKKFELRVQDGHEMTTKRTVPTQIPEFKGGDATNEDVALVTVGMGAHQRPIRREEHHVVDYNYELDLISVGCVLDPATYEGVDEVGVFGMWYSADHGQTWQGPVIINDNLTEGANYYTSGVMFNPDGNTTITDAFGVHQGSILPLAGDWRFKAFGSSTLGGEFLDTQLFEETEYDGYWNFFGLNQIGDEMRGLHLKTVGAWSAFSHIDLQPFVGTFTGEAFEWNFDNIIDANLHVESDNVVSWSGMFVSYDSGAEMAWSDDGEIGYMWMVGVSADEYSGYQPQIFRTEDAGESWDDIFLDFQDGDIQDIIEPYVIEIWTGGMIPSCQETVGVVDVNGDLQMMIAMASHSADCLTYPDSAGYGWTNEPGNLFLCEVDDDGIVELMWVDSLRTEAVPQDDAAAYCGSTGWQHRIQAAKSQDENQVFFTWTDTRDQETFTINAEPDLFGWSKIINCDDPIIMESPICFTEGTDEEGDIYFNCGAERAYDNGEGFTVPTMQGVNALEFIINTVAHEDPITLSYVTGIEFPYLCATGVGGSSVASAINVTQNMPNPFTGSTTIEVSTESASNVKVEVSNLMGQSIYTVDAGIISGSKEIELSAKNLESGVYFYTVRIGSESVTKKMIVE